MHGILKPVTILLTRRAGSSRKLGALNPSPVGSELKLRRRVVTAGRQTLWISEDEELFSRLLAHLPFPPRRLGSAILLHPVPVQSFPIVQACFDPVAYAIRGGFLPHRELAAALVAPNRDELIVGGTVDEATSTITLWRGNLEPLLVPFSAFEPSGDGIVPDFKSFAVTDYGQTIRLGDYEAAVDSILYEYSSEYRRKRARERLARERGLGPSLRRLRKQRGLRREDFAPLSAKTIARIERGEVQALRGKTRSSIAKVLKISPDDIEEY